MNLSSLFPHINRIFPASTFSPLIRLTLLASVVVLLILNAIDQIGPTEQLIFTMNTNLFPSVSILHAGAPALTSTQRILYAQSHEGNEERVLGVSSQTLTPKDSPYELNLKLSRWSDISSSYPEYADALFLKSMYAYRLREDKKAIESFEKAEALNPNYPHTQELQKLFTKGE